MSEQIQVLLCCKERYNQSKEVNPPFWERAVVPLTIFSSILVQQNEGSIDQNADPCFSPVSPVQVVLFVQWPSEHYPLM